jgi:hypothetical protein
MIMKDSNFVFLISQPRAGSTLLQRILHEHSEIATVGEPWFLLPVLKNDFELKVFRNKKYDTKIANYAINEFVNNSSGKNHQIKNYLNLYKSICSEITNNQSKNLFLDKTPRYYYIIDEILEAFPRAKVIILTRNPLDVFNSILNTWVKKKYGLLVQFKEDLFQAPKLLSEGINHPSIYHIKYENLISDQNNELVALCKYLNIDFDEKLMQIGGNKSWALGDPNMNELRTIDATKKDKWLDELTPQKWRFFNDYLFSEEAKFHNNLGYDIENYKLLLKKNKPIFFNLLFTIKLNFYLSTFSSLILCPLQLKIRNYRKKIKNLWTLIKK